MRDIRDDLRERLMALDGRHADAMVDYDQRLAALNKEHRETVAAIERERAALKELLAFEAQRHGLPPDDPLNYVQKKQLRLPLADFLIARVAARGPLDKEGLKAEADSAGYLDAGNGRSFHAALLNMTKHGKLKQLADGRYAAPNGAVETLFGLGQQAAEEQPMMQ
jgi:hypothetical protein